MREGGNERGRSRRRKGQLEGGGKKEDLVWGGGLQLLLKPNLISEPSHRLSLVCALHPPPPTSICKNLSNFHKKGKTWLSNRV